MVTTSTVLKMLAYVNTIIILRRIIIRSKLLEHIEVKVSVEEEIGRMIKYITSKPVTGNIS